MNFGERLRALLDERGMTQRELASRLNIAASTVGSYVQNTREPDFATLRLIAAYFEVSTDYLLCCQSGKAAVPQEDELLRIFRALTPEQRDICVEQCRAFLRAGRKEQARSS